ncbi:rod shape-determining protein RodA [Sporosarcina sp. P26b]|uniref:FtsW/RodA/SpoVE family cell cycle protein n=1 Tax=Sporosarcina TaxID=1569 RepID=UPI000A17D408|nr:MULTISPECIES: FtsW/RodA/SpoVE family cell cycle protein [Sporosarcina]ARK21403.1 rod shape-determining protein RodA [Sporosarcina ureae]PIC72333.1 rod shape-determining protein RodA [Sporosarcina sp. P17b]PIC96411.1 rod shape-determining protein RodA [Sporosarcina sp. P26b]
MKQSNRLGERFDWTLAFIILLFAIISFFVIGSAQTSEQYTQNFVLKQVRWYILGSFIVAMVMYFEPEQYKKFAWYFYGFGIFLLVFLMLAPGGPGQIAEMRYSAKRWLHLPVIGTIQPAEFIKTFFIIGLAKMVSTHNERSLNRTYTTDLLLLGKIALMLVVPLFLIMKQPDLGTSLVFISITAAIVIVSGISWKLLVPIFSLGAAAAGGILWMSLFAQDLLDKFGFSPYQFKRVYSWLDPYSYPTDEGYNLITAMTAIGSGELTGKGFLERVVYIPENHTDFIFSVIGEEYGFIGACLVITLYFILIYHLTKVALSLHDPFSVYVCTGIIAMIAFHVFENIGMNIQLLPITGIPLPFISYGGSSLFSNMLAIGLIFSMKFHQRTYLFDADDDDL